MYKIGEVVKITGMSTDTLRYYEKFGLIPAVSRSASGIRQYSDKDISRLKFIKRAQRMNFSLNEIKELLCMREDPQNVQDSVRKLTDEKLKQVENQLTELTTLRNELQLLMNLCKGSKGGCPIIEGIDTDNT